LPLRGNGREVKRNAPLSSAILLTKIGRPALFALLITCARDRWTATARKADGDGVGMRSFQSPVSESDLAREASRHVDDDRPYAVRRPGEMS
jgi:hypothetical protein